MEFASYRLMASLKSASVDEVLEEEVLGDDEIAPVVSYEVSRYGADPEVEVLVNRLNRGDIYIPPFQRDYVWNQPEASRFIESLLLGLPVPGIFLAIDPASGKQIVIDGQQRLKTLQFFFEGVFNPKPDDVSQRVFSLIKVQPHYEGRTFKTLDENDRMRLQTSIVHATVVKQLEPSEEDTSLYHIFERLNSSGRRLTDQEMRIALFHGKLIDKIKEINLHDTWRGAFGRIHSRLKDQELILRFFAFYESLDKYSRPMGEFLNRYASSHRYPTDERLEQLASIFSRTIDCFCESIGPKPFRLTTTLNAAIYDSCMVGLAHRLSDTNKLSPDKPCIAEAYRNLLNSESYLEAVSRSTADEAFVRRRMDIALREFGEC
jgi:hypothetical protein